MAEAEKDLVVHEFRFDAPKLPEFITLPFKVAAGTLDKPIGELTMPEVLAWAACLCYGIVGVEIAMNVVRVAVGGERRSRR